MIIRTLGSGVTKCMALGDNAKAAAAGKETEVVRVIDFDEITAMAACRRRGW